MSVRTAMLGRKLTVVAAVFDVIATVPAGETWIVKTVNVYNATGGAATVTVEIFNPASNLLAALFDQSVSNGAVAPINVWAVADAGCQLVLRTSVANVYSWWSGTRLNG